MSFSDFATADFATSAPNAGRSRLVSASRTLGYIGLLAWILPVVGVPLTLIGVALGIASLRVTDTGKAVRAILLCTIGLLLNVGDLIVTKGKFPMMTATSPVEIINPHCHPHPSASTTPADGHPVTATP